MAFDAGTILGHLKLDNSGFTGGILKAQGLTNLFGQSISTFLANPLLGVANIAKQATGAIINLVTETADAADKYAKLAASTGASIEFLSGMEHAATLSGTAAEAVSGSLAKLAKNMDDATRGTGEGLIAFQALDIAVTNADGSLRNTQDVFLDAADKLKGITNESQRAALAQKLFGESAGGMIPLLMQGRAGIEGMIDEAKRMGLTFDETAGKSAEAFNDALTRIKGSLAGVARQAAIPIFKTLAPAMENIAGLIGDTLSPMLGRVSELFGKLASVVAENVGPYIEAIIPQFDAVFGVLEAILPVLGPLLKLLGSIAGLVSSILAPALKLLTPVLEVVADVIGVIADGLTAIADGLTGGVNWLLEKIGVGGGGGSGGAGGETNVHVTVDPEASADHVARKVAPQIVSATRGVQSDIEAAAERRASLDRFGQGAALR